MHYLIDPRFSILHDHQIIKSALELWESEFTTILESRGVKFDPDILSRHQLMTIVVADEEVKSLCFHRGFDLSDEQHSSDKYFEKVPKAIFGEWKEMGFKILTTEWVLINPKTRGRFSRVQFADVTMGLALKIFNGMGFDACMGYSRKDLKADAVAKKFGTKELGSTDLFGIDCGIMVCTKADLVPHEIPRVQKYIDENFDNRVELLSERDILWFMKESKIA